MLDIYVYVLSVPCCNQNLLEQESIHNGYLHLHQMVAYNPPLTSMMDRYLTSTNTLDWTCRYSVHKYMKSIKGSVSHHIGLSKTTRHKVNE